MRNSTALVFASAALLAACATGTQRTAGGEIAPMAPINSSWLPAGTSMTAKLDQAIGTASSRNGDTFSATVTNPVYAQDGSIAVPVGAILHGHITGLHHTSVDREQSLIRIAFDDVQMHSRTYPLTASVSSVVIDKQVTGPTGSAIARGAITGMPVGAVISGAALSKIITGGLLGAATGTVISLGESNPDGGLPSGSTLVVRTNEDVRFRF
ncbi:MAG: hypothetical protein ACREPM_17860 [Gemmatimonadaceae bacterium]